MHRPLCIAGIVAAALAAVACGSARPSQYYTLDLPTAPAAAVGAGFPVSLLVGRVSAPHVYRDDRIVYRTSSTRVAAYEYHRWAEPPAEMLEAMLVRRLRAEGKYRSVQLLSSNARGDFVLRGRLHELGEGSGTGRPTARVVFELELFDPASGSVVWTHFYSNEEPVNGKEVSHVVEAINRSVQRGIVQVVASLDKHFSSRP